MDDTWYLIEYTYAGKRRKRLVMGQAASHDVMTRLVESRMCTAAVCTPRRKA